MSTTTSVTASDAVARATELIPELRERAAQTALDRRLPQSNIDALRRAGALKTIQATRNGGYALGIRSHLDVMSALGRGCGSTAWVAGVVHAHSWLVSHFPEQGQDDIYGDNPDAVVSAVIGPRGKAVRTADGYRLEGVWPFGSGCERADWLLLGAVVFDEAGNEIDQGDFMVPQSEVTIKDDWYVSGLAGTGSCTMVATGIDVPAHRFLSLPGPHHGQQPRRRPARRRLGAALRARTRADHRAVRRSNRHRQAGARRLPRRVIKGKVIAYTADPQEPHPFTHIRLGDAAGTDPRRRAAAVLRSPTSSTRPPRPAARSRSCGAPRCATTARPRCVDCWKASRSCSANRVPRGVRTSSPINRAMADLQTINNHGLMKLETNQEMYGRLLLGLEPNTPLI